MKKPRLIGIEGAIKRLIGYFSVVLIALTVVPSAHAATIIDQSQTTNTGSWAALNSSSNWNQSFTAGANNVAGAGIYLTAGSPTDGTMTLEIWDGLSGLGGTLLATGTTNTDPNQLDSWVDIFWTPVSLSIGNTYYLQITGDTQTFFAFGNGDPYAGGNIFSGTDGVQAPADNDLMFRTYYDTAFIPVPAAVWLFGSGLLGLLAIARRKAG